MYHCEDCGKRFDKPKDRTIIYSYGEVEKLPTCPHCSSVNVWEE